ncbi:TPA: hypothetical protein N0F65_010800 [Lagenidium giganteum]|uniref:Uncharacterized protein n=1 Tax=Lagenidium giganteum TaxID=4803 RepID=A0AAV2YJW2_9STRA|nr:TPA: hypothetical protein N0F65_010800 [Lagenidium giganteum]
MWVDAHTRLPTDDELLIAETTKRWRNARTAVLDRAIEFSWLRVLGSVSTYVLLCSDVVRSGIGIPSIAMFPAITPSTVQINGPWAYSVSQITRSQGDVADVAVWSYKFDSTSISWRAFALHWNLSSFPDCIMYRTACPGMFFNRTHVFAMMDSLASTIASQTSQDDKVRGLHQPSPVSLTLRSAHRYTNVFHHLLLPQVFTPPRHRTNQIVYFPPELLMARPNFDVCGFRSARPSYCLDLWANYRRSCKRKSSSCTIGHVSHDIRRRFQALQKRFPNNFVDLTILTSTEDEHVNLGGVAFQSYRGFDVTTILRVRECNDNTSTACETLLVDDHRYEGGFTTTDVTEWFAIAASLRVLAQCYFALRLLMLMIGCFVARRAETAYQNATVWTVMGAALRTMSKIPCQGIVYGSPVPVMWYVLAHLIDAPMTYRLAYERFTTMLGSGTGFKVTEACTICAIQMRNVWLLGVTLQFFVWLSCRGTWSPPRGIRGLPEFSLSVLSVATVLAQYKHNDYRVAQVLSAFPIGSDPHRTAVLRANGSYKNTWTVITEGIIIDIKCLSILLLLALGFKLAFHALMEKVHERADEGHAVVALMNLYAMTDPLTFIQLRCFRGYDIAFFQLPDSGHVCCLPLSVATKELDGGVPWKELQLIGKTTTPSMEWTDLLHCG